MAKLLLEYETIDVPQIDAIMESRDPPPPMGWNQGGPGKDAPKPITIGGPAAPTCSIARAMPQGRSPLRPSLFAGVAAAAPPRRRLVPPFPLPTLPGYTKV